MSRVVDEKKGFFKIAFLSFVIAMIVTFIILFLAIIFYPGGNHRGENIDYYSILYNGLCDIKEKTTIGTNEPNLISSILVKIGAVFLSLILAFFFIILCFFFQSKKSTKILSIIGTILAIAHGPSFILMFLHNTAFEVHMIYVIIAPLFLYLAVILYTVAYFIDRELPKINRYSFLILAIASISLAIIAGIGSAIGGDLHHIGNRLGPNIFLILSLVVYLIQGLSFYNYLRKPRQNIKNQNLTTSYSSK